MALQPSFSFDVFLSFRGTDTRYGITGYLYKALCDKGIHTFIDSEELQRGHEITPSLVKAIHESRIAIPVFSTNYASSTFCLDELVMIMDSFKANGQLVLPVFYNVDPSDVRHQRGSYGEAMAKHDERFKDDMEKVNKWRIALHQVANLSGYHFTHGDGHEHKFIEKIVGDVSRKIKPVILPVADYPIGLEDQVSIVTSLLNVGSNDGVHMVGIHGIGGIGKTTLALAVYNSIADHFEGSCFLENVRENSNKNGLEHLQNIILSELLGDKEIKITSVKQGISVIQHRLQRKKILLILDDVDKQEQLQAIIGKPSWFGLGSKIIITTRDKHLLACHGVERMYEVEGLDNTKALELLCWKAFKTINLNPIYIDVLNRAVTYACGLPLALEVIGSNLFEKGIKEWESALDQYEKIPNSRIHDILKVSFDALEEDEQSVFLDIACCFKGYKVQEVEDILQAHHGGCMKYHIGVLVERSLVKIRMDWVDERVTLHDLIEDMGKEIVRRTSPKEPGKRSRLWFHEDIIQVIEDNQGTAEIEIIHLDFPSSKMVAEKQVEWDGEAFRKMKNLKTLIMKNGYFSEDPKYLPNSLRVLEWWRYPSQSLPFNFHPKYLSIVKLPDYCCMSFDLALSSKKFVKLKVLNFDVSKYLREIPDMSGLPNLEKLSFQYCRNLTTIHNAVGFLDKLKILSAIGCRRLRSFPPIKLPSLETLLLSECRGLENFPEVRARMENITELHLRLTGIKELPFSSFAWFVNVKELDLSFNNFTNIPACIKECRFLWKLEVDYCPHLREIRGIPPNLKYFTARNCENLSSSCRSILLNQELHEPGNTKFIMPGSRVPEWFEHRSWGPPISFWFRNQFPAIAFCFAIEPDEPYYSGFSPFVMIINRNKRYTYSDIGRFKHNFQGDHIYLADIQEMEFQLDEALLENEWNHAEVSCSTENHGFLAISDKDPIEKYAKESGVHVFKQESRMEDIRFSDPHKRRKLDDDLSSPESSKA